MCEPKELCELRASTERSEYAADIGGACSKGQDAFSIVAVAPKDDMGGGVKMMISWSGTGAGKIIVGGGPKALGVFCGEGMSSGKLDAGGGKFS